MSIIVDANVEARLRERAEVEGLSVPDCVESLVNADQAAEDDLEFLTLEGLTSGEPIEVGLAYWEEKHRRLDERLMRTATR
jgi:hypothetical protein